MSLSGQDPAAERREPSLFIRSTAPPRPARRMGGVNVPVLVVGGVVAALAIFAGFTLLAPHSALMDSLNGATPSISEAKTCLRDRDFNCAEADLRAYMRKYPNDANTGALLAITLTQDGQHKEALPYYRKAVADGVSTYDLFANYAISLDTTGQTDEAIKQNYAALKLVPNLVDVRGALADQLVKRGKVQEALTVLEGFDQTLQDEGQPPYFAAKSSQIRARFHLAAAGPAAAAGPVGAPAPEVALQAENGALYVPALVDGAITLRFVVDSGASDVVIPGDVARTLMRMGKLSSADYRGVGMAILADGSRVPAQRVVLHSLTVGGHEVKDVLASITDARGSLLLGQSFLRHFKSWSIDNRRHVLVLQG
ncbi:aspartyl protease family protein [Caulobacter sp. KR2-114]|uniref:aspartyl protease family protein n=1 Tax=Caulobacter sp. KR2-114 TaxID=3400912 RepID=UPI003BFBA814